MRSPEINNVPQQLPLREFQSQIQHLPEGEVAVGNQKVTVTRAVREPSSASIPKGQISIRIVIRDEDHRSTTDVVYVNHAVRDGQITMPGSLEITINRDVALMATERDPDQPIDYGSRGRLLSEGELNLIRQTIKEATPLLETVAAEKLAPVVMASESIAAQVEEVIAPKPEVPSPARLRRRAGLTALATK